MEQYPFYNGPGAHNGLLNGPGNIDGTTNKLVKLFSNRSKVAKVRKQGKGPFLEALQSLASKLIKLK